MDPPGPAGDRPRSLVWRAVTFALEYNYVATLQSHMTSLSTKGNSGCISHGLLPKSLTIIYPLFRIAKVGRFLRNRRLSGRPRCSGVNSEPAPHGGEPSLPFYAANVFEQQTLEGCPISRGLASFIPAELYR